MYYLVFKYTEAIYLIHNRFKMLTRHRLLLNRGELINHILLGVFLVGISAFHCNSKLGYLKISGMPTRVLSKALIS